MSTMGTMGTMSTLAPDNKPASPTRFAGSDPAGSLLLRLARPDDMAAIFQMAQHAGEGMTTLKPNRAAIEARLDNVVQTMRGVAPKDRQEYVFVLEDLALGKTVGLSGIKSFVGLDQPFYSFRLSTLVHASAQLGVIKSFQTMDMSNDMTGAAELCSLFLLPESRNGFSGRLLSKSRLLFMTLFPDRFPSRVMAEMRGYQDERGKSPFWEEFARQFFDVEFAVADTLTSEGVKTFIPELMPRYPIYTNLLPPSARAVIGEVHRETRPARRLLEQEGLSYGGYIDIFDGGPQIASETSNLRMRREAVCLNVVIAEHRSDRSLLVSSTNPETLTAIVTHGCAANGAICLTASEAAALGVGPGGQVAVVPLNPSEPDSRAGLRDAVLFAPAAAHC